MRLANQGGGEQHSLDHLARLGAVDAQQLRVFVQRECLAFVPRGSTREKITLCTVERAAPIMMVTSSGYASRKENSPRGAGCLGIKLNAERYAAVKAKQTRRFWMS
jgi:hypothetical protein